MTSLNNPVLVLNKVWMAIRVIPAHRALTLVFANKASAIDNDDFYAYKWDDWIYTKLDGNYDEIISTRGSVKIPKIIVLSTYDKVFRKDVSWTKRNVHSRDNNVCQYSGKLLKPSELDIDHIIPKSRGGQNTFENTLTCSKAINRLKDNRTPEEAGLKLIREPVKPSANQLVIDVRGTYYSEWDKFLGGNK